MCGVYYFPINRKYGILLFMNTLIHADIFFFITAVWVIFISAIVVYILWNVAQIASDARHISKKIREGNDILSEDLKDLRDSIISGDVKSSNFWKYAKHIFSKGKGRKK